MGVGKAHATVSHELTRDRPLPRRTPRSPRQASFRHLAQRLQEAFRVGLGVDQGDLQVVGGGVGRVGVLFGLEAGQGVAATHLERLALYRKARNRAAEGFRRYAQTAQLCPWVTAPYPTPGWAQEVFPELADDEAFDRLAELIFRFTYGFDARQEGGGAAHPGRSEAAEAHAGQEGVRGGAQAGPTLPRRLGREVRRRRSTEMLRRRRGGAGASPGRRGAGRRPVGRRGNSTCKTWVENPS